MMLVKRDAPSLPKTPLNREEELLLARAASVGDRAAERRIAQMLFKKIRSIVSYTVNDAALAEDITQSAMMHILSSLGDYRGESSIEFWAARIAIRMALRAVKTARRRRYLLLFLPEPRTPFRPPHEQTQSMELRREINALVGKLPEKQQVAVRLRYVHEYSIEEIAELTEAPENTVRDRLQVGKKKLKRLLEKNPALSAWIARGGNV